ncbi:MAG: bi-domain-containing oxidoreductase [Allosphingosinicella sp.]|uniref:bi-domain-containing oxidoreductase n=1 Tax=Allosphingosinicella sp. TaxID=2823234 RepID=UPI00393A6E48
MKQVLQSLSNGQIEVAEVPAPVSRGRHLTIAARASLLSAGTERMLLDFGRSSLVGKALKQPQRVKDVLTKMRTDGVMPTIEAVRSKLDQPIPLGYCSAGIVHEVGPGVEGFEVGDRVVSNGSHAEVVCVPQTLCARIPDGVSDEEAAFTPLGAIALQGIRLIQPTLGEKVVVIGLGLIGLMAVQILRANGCRVLGLDFDPDRLAMAQRFGAEVANAGAGDPVAAAMRFTGGRGADAVLITASTSSSEPLAQAAGMSRKRGRIVLVGVIGSTINRADFYEKELSFQVSCSYGPGRYDPDYEDRAVDYPYAFVRWTEQRNFEAVLDLMADGRLDVRTLISKRVPIAEANAAYESLIGDPKMLGIIVEYPEPPADTGPAAPSRWSRYIPLGGARQAAAAGAARIAVIGAGNYASRVLIPAMKEGGADIAAVVSRSGLSSFIHGRKSGAEAAATDIDAVLADDSVSGIVIATRHDSHADLTARALAAGKSVFVEKPLAIDDAGIDAVAAAYEAPAAGASPLLMVGFNRRFAPLVVRMKALADQLSVAKTLIMTVNAGDVPAHTWVQNREEGGGRIVGEGCHWIDLMRFLVGHPITGLAATRLGAESGDAVRDDKATLTLSFADGSHGTIHYFANGAKSFPKERIELFGGGRILQLDNYRTLVGHGWPGFTKARSRGGDKGQSACAAAFLQALRGGGPAPIPYDELIEVSRWSIRAGEFAG